MKQNQHQKARTKQSLEKQSNPAKGAIPESNVNANDGQKPHKVERYQMKQMADELARRIRAILQPDFERWINESYNQWCPKNVDTLEEQTRREFDKQREVGAFVEAVNLAIYGLAETLVKTIRQPHPDGQRTVVDAAQTAFKKVENAGLFVKAAKNPSFAEDVVNSLFEIQERAELKRQWIEKEQKELAQYASFFMSSQRKKR